MKALDLFAGAGGFSLAAHNLGYVDVVAAIEFDKAAAHTYKENLINRLKRETKLLQKDILLVSPKELRAELKLEKKELSLILGGPPCQGFSSHRLKDSGVNDPRNKLLLRYFAFVDEFQPKIFLVENVSGLLWERHKSYLDDFKKLSKDNNYTLTHCSILNARDYGVPQNRKRVFILGVRNDIYKDKKEIHFPPLKTHFSPSSFEVKFDGKKAWRTASSVFEKLTPALIERYLSEHFSKKKNYNKDEILKMLESLEFESSPVNINDPCNIHMKPTPNMEARFNATVLNGSRADAGLEFQLKCHSDGYEGHKDVYGRMMIHLPSNTITTGCHNPSKGRFVHPWKNHGITLRHAARLQTFPDDFLFTGNTTEQARQIGNAVPPLLGEILISSISQLIV
ncbi:MULTISPECIES: DNA cytosine methyltransferase [Pantoea]|uniref:DNA cytosine methyltransferase n=1 Tax=Pantoea TaxID=53335 RepID=UPI0007C7A89E|nr:MULTISPECIES: DNA cytosine methyltransferase [Pantoea]MBW1251368.1 DNA cytosine methyltransferase [Pantoea allii]MBW1261153.1 DNA cytosine methyltransferase [Pantoea allii]MBW1282562.1 DNA cytosine methyltransferase [Pantoea allii]OAE07149.1 cytosine methyltransferase [Pantoea sp. OXWO6B1]ORM88800.1 DNA (cytosine-5-)-methyltransferase [Pantoea allii]